MTRTEERLIRPTDAVIRPTDAVSRPTVAVSGLESAYAHLATKADVADLKGELKSDIANLKADLIKCMVIALAVWGGVLIGAIQFIP